MRCNQCGFLSEYDINFCPRCGSSIGQAESDNLMFHIEDEPGFASRDAEYIKPAVLPLDHASIITNRRNPENDPAMGQEGGKPYNKSARAKLLLGISVLVTAVVLIYVIFLRDKIDSVFYELSNQGLQVYTNENITLVFDREGNIIQHFDEPGYPQNSMDRSAVVIYMSRVGDDGRYEMYYVTAEDCLKFSDDATTFGMTADGRYLIYALRTQENGFQLYRYDGKSKKDTLLYEQEGKQLGMLRSSPDGKIIAYTTFSNDFRMNGQAEAFLIKDGKTPKSLGERIIIAVSNGAEYIYSCDYKNGILGPFYISKNGEETKLIDNPSNLWINWDYSEILFVDEDKTYLYDGRTESIRDIADSMATDVIVPYPYMSSYSNRQQAAAYDSFKNKVIRCRDNTLYAINKKYEVNRICKLDQVSQIALSLDGNSLLYSTAEGSVIKVEDIYDECRETILVKEMDTYITTGDLSEVYYLIGDELFYKNDRGETKWVAEGVSMLMSNGDYSAALFKMDRIGFRGVLYYSHRGNEPEQLLDGAYVSDFRHLEYGILVQAVVPGGYEYYYNYKGSRMKLLQDEIKE